MQEHYTVLWEAKKCSFAKSYQRLGGTCSLNLQDGTVTFYKRLHIDIYILITSYYIVKRI